MEFETRTPARPLPWRHAMGATLLWGLCLAAAVAADTPPPPPAGQRPMGPPPEAVAACNGKAAGAQVEFTLRDGKRLTGTCSNDNGVLAARPAGMPPHPPGSAPAAR